MSTQVQKQIDKILKSDAGIKAVLEDIEKGLTPDLPRILLKFSYGRMIKLSKVRQQLVKEAAELDKISDIGEDRRNAIHSSLDSIHEHIVELEDKLESLKSGIAL